MAVPLIADIGEDNDNAEGHTKNLRLCVSQFPRTLDWISDTYAIAMLKSSQPNRPLFVYLP